MTKLSFPIFSFFLFFTPFLFLSYFLSIFFLSLSIRRTVPNPSRLQPLPLPFYFTSTRRRAAPAQHCVLQAAAPAQHPSVAARRRALALPVGLSSASVERGGAAGSFFFWLLPPHLAPLSTFLGAPEVESELLHPKCPFLTIQKLLEFSLTIGYP